MMVGKGARAMLVESHEGPAGSGYQVNAALELFVGDDAHVDHVKIVGEGADALHISTLAAAIGAQGAVQHVHLHHRRRRGAATSSSSILTARTPWPTSAAQRCSRAASTPTPRWSSTHIARGCQSREVFKSVLDDEAHGVFQGRIIVRPNAQQTDAKMMTRALLLSDQAEADNKPELEIFADDVQCGHGATAGALDEELKFYLMARGIPDAEAEALLIQAFLGEAIEGIEHAGLREALMRPVAAWLEARG